MNRTFTVDRATWRCGGNGPYRHGDSSPALNNPGGYRCCLGHICHQTDPKADFFWSFPKLGEHPNFFDLFPDDLLYRLVASTWILDAAAINDDSSLTDAEREAKLIAHGLTQNIHITFVGEFPAQETACT